MVHGMYDSRIRLYQKQIKREIKEEGLKQSKNPHFPTRVKPAGSARERGRASFLKKGIKNERKVNPAQEKGRARRGRGRCR